MSFAEWKVERPALDEIDVGGFWFNTIGTSLHEVDGQLFLAVLVDDDNGLSVVLALDAEQSADVRALLPMRKETFRPVHEWLKSLDLDGNEVLGRTTNEVYVAFSAIADDSRADG